MLNKHLYWRTEQIQIHIMCQTLSCFCRISPGSSYCSIARVAALWLLSFSVIILTALHISLKREYTFSNSFSSRKKQKCIFLGKRIFLHVSVWVLTVALTLITKNIFWHMAAGGPDWQLMKDKEDSLHGKNYY